MKWLPDLLTGLRICSAVMLLFTTPFGAVFYGLYLFGGISDVLDGYLARRWQAVSQIGAVMDSVADLVFAAVCLFILLPQVSLSVRLLYGIAGVAAVRLLSAAVGWMRFGRLVLVHTWSNKAAGLLLFLFVFTLHTAAAQQAAWLVCAAAGISAIEELVINLTSRIPDPDRKSLFLRE